MHRPGPEGIPRVLLEAEEGGKGQGSKGTRSKGGARRGMDTYGVRPEGMGTYRAGPEEVWACMGRGQKRYGRSVGVL